MITWLKNFYKTYRAWVLYVAFGAVTCAVNFGVYYATVHWFGWAIMTGTILAWMLSVLAAYLTNRRWVFGSTKRGPEAIIKEMIVFYGCRALTGVFDWGIMLAFATRPQFNDMLVKVFANIFVIIANFVASKLIIFRENSR